MIRKPGILLLAVAIAGRIEFAAGAALNSGAARPDAAQRGGTGRAHDADAQHRREGGAQLSRAAAGDSAFDRGLSDRHQRQQMPVLPCPRAHRRVAGADGLASPTSWTATASSSPRCRRAASSAPRATCRRRGKPPVANDFVESTPCSAARPRRAAMSAADPAAPRLMRRGVSAFAVELWDVLRRPSSVFGLGVLVLAGFVAGIIFWGGFNTALEITNTEKFCTGCHEMRDNVFAGAEVHHPFHQPLGRARDLPGLPRAAQLDRQDRAQDAGLQGSLGPSVRHHQHPRKIPRPPARAGDARMGAAQGERLARMPQLPQRRVDGHHQAEPRAAAAHQRFLFTGEKERRHCPSALKAGFASRPVSWPRKLGDVPGPYSQQPLAWFSFRNYGFSDGADLFVFISGYTSVFVFTEECPSAASFSEQRGSSGAFGKSMLPTFYCSCSTWPPSISCHTGSALPISSINLMSVLCLQLRSKRSRKGYC